MARTRGLRGRWLRFFGAGLAMALVALIAAACSSGEAALPETPTPIPATAIPATQTPVPPTPTPAPPTVTPVPPTATPVPPTPTPTSPAEVNGILLRPLTNPIFFRYPTQGLDRITTQAEADAVWVALVVDDNTSALLGDPDHISTDFDEVKRKNLISEGLLDRVETGLASGPSDGLVHLPGTEVVELDLEYEDDGDLLVHLCLFLQAERVVDGQVVPSVGTTQRTTVFDTRNPEQFQLFGFRSVPVSEERVDRCF